VLKNWEKLKAAEKQSSPAVTKENHTVSRLDAVPKSLPALLEAYQLSRRAAKAGFDWQSVEGIFEKLEEETAELREALRGRTIQTEASYQSSDGSRQVEEEAGDLLFTVVNLVRFLGIDPEVALKGTNKKFKSRFQDMERVAARAGKDLSS